MADEAAAQPTDSSITAMADLVKNLQAGMQQLATKMRGDSQELIDKCKLVSPLGGDFRDFHELAYILNYVRGNKELRREVVEFIRVKVEAGKPATTGGTPAATTGTTTP